MKTRFSEDVTKDTCWQEHPRPQAERKNWLNLNGEWSFSFTDKMTPPKENECERKILVPFSWESNLSGLGVYTPVGRAFYVREVTFPQTMKGKRILLHFDAVDFEAEVFIDGVSIGMHRGGYDPFTFDISDKVSEKDKFILAVRVYDPTRDGGQATGKQDVRRFNDPRGCMYVPNSGIWQTVWLEATEESYIKDFTINADALTGNIKINTETVFDKTLRNFHIQALVYLKGQLIAGNTGKPDEEFSIHLEDALEWSPETPILYNIVIRLMQTSKNVFDEIKTYTAFRTIAVKEVNGIKKIALNDQIIFQVGPLDQGYWPDGIYTPPTDEAQAWEISEIKRFGFNMIRKHAKVENFRWYYWCDFYGMLVWQDMPSSFATGGKFNSDADKGETKPQNLKAYREQLKEELTALINTHKNLPCIIIWTVFNEGWGEFDTVKMTEYAMSLDKTRLFIPNSGYNCSEDIEVGDIKDVHNYLPPKCPEPTKNRVVVCGEYGSLGYVCAGHMYNEVGPYHGMVCSDSKEATRRYCEFMDEIIEMRDKKGLCAAVYTQWTDVENEINGIYSYDRDLEKLDRNIVYECNQKAINGMNK